MQKVLISTTMGDITIELYPEKSPITVKNFLEYVDAHHYEGMVFHRVIEHFMIQGGGLDKDLKERSTLAPIKNEANNMLKNDKYTIAMARTMDPHSATCQFFINVQDNGFLNFRDETLEGWGYTVFGKVVSGMDLVDKISEVKTGKQGRHSDVPLEPITILKAQLVD